MTEPWYKKTFNSFWRRPNLQLIEKNAKIAEESGEGLQRVLTWYELIGYGFAFTVGSGIWVISGQVAHEQAGPAIVFSFIVAGIASLLSAFCYSEFAARVPLSGSAYTFSYVTLGELVAWFIGWNLTLEYAISASVVARSWASYFMQLWNNFFPNHRLWMWLIQYDVPYTFNLVSLSPVSLLIIMLCTGLLLFGIKDNATFNLILTLVNFTVIMFVIVCGVFYVEPKNWEPFFPYGASGIFSGAGTAFFSYIGFDSVTTLAGEVRNPKVDLPIGIIGTLGLATILYIGVSLVLTGMVKYDQINVNAPIADAFSRVGNTFASDIAAIGSLTTLSATTFVTLLGQPRIFYQMAKDGLLHPAFGNLNKRGVPVFGTLVSGAFAGVFGFFFSLNILANMISIGTLMAFTVVCAGVLVLRLQNKEKPSHIPIVVLIFIVLCGLSAIAIIHVFPLWAMIIYLIPPILIGFTFLLFPTLDVPDTFKTPLVPLIPCLGIYVNLYLIFALDIWSIVRVFIWTILGTLIYLFYGMKHSVLNTDNKVEDTDIGIINNNAYDIEDTDTIF
eukprot:TRINITY_DN4722_c1_g1_i1.p1 TRINITY_DN4722_c1_g1~~TRINITY_DN4722_c1_g1_i1.p1  ORF type:complete len:558 (+),score=150.03 TRINITY_DN4722_c1_g1_i1:61-1734(+)